MDVLKLRLRGKGSGFKEGPDNRGNKILKIYMNLFNYTIFIIIFKIKEIIFFNIFLYLIIFYYYF